LFNTITFPQINGTYFEFTFENVSKHLNEHLSMVQNVTKSTSNIWMNISFYKKNVFKSEFKICSIDLWECNGIEQLEIQNADNTLEVI
jgi:hypothetical protein